jgi:rhodanese-related sulfurtransferase
MQDIFLFAQNHAMLSIALLIVLLLLAVLELIKSKRGTQQLSPAGATQLINHQDAIVLDIRNTEAFNSGHIVDAISIPFSELENKYKKLDSFKARPILIVCATGSESPRAAGLLEKEGFKVFLLAGGIRSWKETDMPLVKE